MDTGSYKLKTQINMSQYLDSIPPHGGQLINRIATLDQRQEFLDKA